MFRGHIHFNTCIALYVLASLLITSLTGNLLGNEAKSRHNINVIRIC